MAYKILMTPDAANQIDNAANYYKVFASKKTASNFLKEFKTTCKSILEILYFQVYFHDFRAIPMKKFPFLIFYTIDEPQNLIIIKAVFHTSQNPEKYPKR